jgi:phosphatidylserine synthase
MTYTWLLALHSVWRWVVVAAVVVRVARAVGSRAEPYTALDKRLGLFAMIALDVQLLLGFGLYAGPSPATAAAFANVGAAMKDASLRFWLVEHASLMTLAVVFGHVANIRVRRLAEDASKHRAVAIFFGLSILCMVLAMPWPFRAVIGRPWLPGL